MGRYAAERPLRGSVAGHRGALRAIARLYRRYAPKFGTYAICTKGLLLQCGPKSKRGGIHTYILDRFDTCLDAARWTHKVLGQTHGRHKQQKYTNLTTCTASASDSRSVTVPLIRTRRVCMALLYRLTAARGIGGEGGPG